MSYEKPQFVILGDLSDVVKGTVDKGHNFAETMGGPGYPVLVTSAAYEADE